MLAYLLAALLACVAIAALVVACLAYTDDSSDSTQTSSLTAEGAVVADSLHAAGDTRTQTLTVYGGVRAYGVTELDQLQVNQSMGIQGELQADELRAAKLTAPLIDSGSASPVSVVPGVSTGDVKASGQVTGATGQFGAVQANGVNVLGTVQTGALLTTNLGATGIATISGNVTVGGDHKVAGVSTLNNLNVTGATNLSGPLALASADIDSLHVSNGLLVDTAGAAQFDVPTTVTGPLTFDGFTGGSGTVQGLTVAGTFATTGSASMPSISTQDLTTIGLDARTATFAQGFGSLTGVTNYGLSDLRQKVTVGQDVASGQTALDVKHNAVVGGTLAVTGAATMGALIAPSATIAGTTITGTLAATTVNSSTVNANAITSANTMEAKGSITLGASNIIPNNTCLDAKTLSVLRGPTIVHLPLNPYVIRAQFKTGVALQLFASLPAGPAMWCPMVELSNNIAIPTFLGVQPPGKLQLARNSAISSTEDYAFQTTVNFTGMYQISGFVVVVPPPPPLPGPFPPGTFPILQDPVNPLEWSKSLTGFLDNATAKNNIVYNSVFGNSNIQDNFKFSGTVRLDAGEPLVPLLVLRTLGTFTIQDSEITLSLISIL